MSHMEQNVVLKDAARVLVNLVRYELPAPGEALDERRHNAFWDAAERLEAVMRPEGQA